MGVKWVLWFQLMVRPLLQGQDAATVRGRGDDMWGVGGDKGERGLNRVATTYYIIKIEKQALMMERYG